MNVINWLARQLFGANAGQALSQAIEARVGAFVASNGSAATQDQAVAFVEAQLGALSTQIAGAFPSWARPAVVEIIEDGASSVVRAVFQKLSAAAKTAPNG